jgi:hypothetical protein
MLQLSHSLGRFANTFHARENVLQPVSDAGRSMFDGDNPAHAALRAELATWHELAVRPRLWWRDDDADRPSPALDRILALAQGRPMTCAVIPERNVHGLSKRLSGRANVMIAQHGVDHHDRRSPGCRPGEHRIGATASELAAPIAAARARMESAGLVPCLFVPAWNRIDRHLPEALLSCGFGSVSAGGSLRDSLGALARLDVHLDLLDTNPNRFKGEPRLSERLRKSLARRRLSSQLGVPIGLLTHHKSHDAETWSFLECFLAWATSEFEWTGFPSQPGMSRREISEG